MAEDNKRLLILGSKSGGGGGGGDATWGSIGGNINNQTDLMNALNAKASVGDIPTKTSDLTNDSGYITLSDIPAQTQADWTETDTSSPAFIVGKPTIPTVNDATITFEDSEGTTIDTFTLNQSTNKTITIPSGGSNAWYGTQEEFDAIPQDQLDPGTNYYITDRLDWSEIANTPTIPTDTGQLTNGAGFVDQSSLDDKMAVMTQYIKDRDVYLTAAEYAALEQGGLLEEDKNYHIEGDVSTVQAVVTFTDSTTATYDVYIKPSI